MEPLEAELLAAHERGDKGALVALYTLAAERQQDVDALCFFLTHAYVFALETGDSRAETLRARLVAQRREG